MNGSPPSLGRGPEELRALLEASPHIADDGFTARVVAAMPRRQRSGRLSRRLVPASLVAACVLAFAMSGTSLVHRGGHGLASLALVPFATFAIALLLVAATLVPSDA